MSEEKDLREEVEGLEEEQNEMYEHFRFVTDAGQKQLRIDKFLVNRMENASRNKIQEAASAGNILVDGVAVKANYKIKANETITIVMEYPRREIEIIPEDIPINIHYEDDYLLVINKDPGMVVHPGHGNYSGTLVNALAHHLKGLPLFNAEDPRPGLVHRIDKDTSGLLVVAKTEQAKSHLARQFFDKTTERKYIALVWGDVQEDEGTVTGHIGRSLKNRLQMSVFPDGEFGKHAVTHYKVIERLGYVTMVQCVLETGRTHQIRAHMKYIGHTLFNDARYGGNEILKGTTFTKYKQFVQNCFKMLPRQALHAKSLGFIHPHTGEKMSFTTELPKDMTDTIEKWKGYIASRDE
ncbi:RluA family pseudouridine synthase [Labilibacter marinus]|uniref:RluA family pseudouridine synthase n=1 Tax=Labilibacter marinus TaxID=1477105 RepID=UPI00082EB404|nr:RluA family pseudouridine synthase [Labilibacter marinus]